MLRWRDIVSNLLYLSRIRIVYKQWLQLYKYLSVKWIHSVKQCELCLLVFFLYPPLNKCYWDSVTNTGWQTAGLLKSAYENISVKIKCELIVVHRPYYPLVELPHTLLLATSYVHFFFPILFYAFNNIFVSAYFLIVTQLVLSHSSGNQQFSPKHFIT